MRKQDNGGGESLLDQRKELLEELINSDIIDEEHGYYDDVKEAIQSNNSEQMREIIDELLSSGLIYKDDWDYKLARKLSKEGKKFDLGGSVDDSDDYGTFEIYKNGGSIEVNVVNSDKKYNEKEYDWILGDKDKDGVANADDTKPLDKTKSELIDTPSITTGIKSLISLKKSLDSTMFSFIDDLKNVAPDNSKIYARTKTPYSVLDKLIKKRLSTITDLIGTTIVTSDKKELDSVKKYIDSGKLGKIIELEDMYKNPKGGYRAYHYLIERNGMSIELQLKTKRQKALNELSHEPYKLGKINSALLLKITEIANRADEGDNGAIKEYNEFMKTPNIENVFYAEKMVKGGGVGNVEFKIKFDNDSENSGEIITPYTYKIVGYSDSFELKVRFKELYKGTYSFDEYNICQFNIESDNIDSAIKLAIERLKYIFKDGIPQRNSDEIFVVSGFQYDKKNTKKPYTPSFMENTHSMNQFTENTFKTKKGDLLKYDRGGDGYGFWYLVNKNGEKISNRLKGSILVGYISDGVLFKDYDKYALGGGVGNYKEKNETMDKMNKYAVGGEVGNQVSFKGDYGTPRSGIVKEKRGSSYIVATDNGDRLVDSYEVISFSDAPMEKKKRFGFFEGGGKIDNWMNAEAGDSARVISENKMGLIIKDYGRKFHLKFVDGSEKTYDASELEFYRFEDEDEDEMFEGGGEIEGKISDLQAVVDGDFPQFAKDKAKAEIERLKKQLQESKETKAEDKEEDKAGGSEAKKPTTRKAPVKKAADKSKVVGDDLKVIKFFDLTESDWNKMALNERNKLSDSYKEKNKPAKADHKKLLAKIKAKKGAAPSNEPSKGHKRSESSDRKREALPLGKRVSADGNTYYENRLNRADISKEDKFEGGGSVDNRVLVVLDEGYGKVINNLFNQWNNVKTEKQYNSWIENVKKSKFGTYGTISINEVLEKFEFDKSNVNSVKKSDFKKEINNALKKFAEGGEIKNSGWGLKFLKW